ncbi:hypothetical protein PR048_021148 [Dryococelus australis]|uniref:Uncharacterized protein n=1 Tax=Dryococelus australis TaxID=614101 RepID=A0ABQ9GXG0_9NEOP|nr:hypothetical protein PR048_021148 [Dryococelus australis]
MALVMATQSKIILTTIRFLDSLLGKIEVFRQLTSHPSEPGSIPGGVAPEFPLGRRIFSRVSHFRRPFIPALLHTHLASPSSARKTTMLRATPTLFTHSLTTVGCTRLNNELCVQPDVACYGRINIGRAVVCQAGAKTVTDRPTTFRHVDGLFVGVLGWISEPFRFHILKYCARRRRSPGISEGIFAARWSWTTRWHPYSEARMSADRVTKNACFEAEERVNHEDDTPTHIRCAIVVLHKVLEWRAVFSPFRLCPRDS